VIGGVILWASVKLLNATASEVAAHLLIAWH
jgi:hypothetical protein